MNSQQVTLMSMIDPTLKLKQLYLKLGTVKRIMVFREEVVIINSSRFLVDDIPRILRVMLRHGSFSSEYETDADETNYASFVRIVFESTNAIDNLPLIKPIAREFLADSVSITSSRSQVEVSYIEAHKNALRTATKVYQPLGMLCEISSYGILDVDGSTTYLYSITLDDSSASSTDTKHKICLKYMLPSEMISGNIQGMSRLANESLDVFKLPDNERIDFSSRTANGFTHRGKQIAYGKATFLKDVLPEAGWFVKVNKRIGKTVTVLLLETSWPLTPSQKSYVDKHRKRTT